MRSARHRGGWEAVRSPSLLQRIWPIRVPKFSGEVVCRVDLGHLTDGYTWSCDWFWLTVPVLLLVQCSRGP